MLHEVSFTSYNERDQVQAWIYVPACKPNGIVQLIHGFGEHSRRYIHMISAFLDAGYIVAADDHVGHGKTAMVNNVWGDWGDKGYHTMMEDEHTLKKIVCEKYPNLPYFLFGHSMGSFITRDFIAKYGNELMVQQFVVRQAFSVVLKKLKKNWVCTFRGGILTISFFYAFFH